MRAIRWTMSALAFVFVATAQASAIARPATNEPRLHADTATLPLVLIKGYPFVEATINGRKGKLLFDLGSVPALSINSDAVRVGGAIPTGLGVFGSGQTHQTMRFPLIKSLVLPGGLTFRAMTNINGNSGKPLAQHITPDFIGWLGLGFFDGYVARLDYDKAAVSFFRDDSGGKGARAATTGETEIETVALGNPAHRNLATFPIKVGAVGMVGLIDTGSHTSAWLSDDQVAALEHAGNLHKDDRGDFTISGITINGLALPHMPIEIIGTKAPFAKFLPQPDAPILALGYEFLKLRRTVIDYNHSRIMILATKR